MTENRPPLPPFTRETAIEKVRGAENGWNTWDPVLVSHVYTPDSYWRNRSDFVHGRDEIVAFLTRKWRKELDYCLIKELWAFTDNRIAVRFAYEWRDDSGKLFRSYGNENREFAANGLMQRRVARSMTCRSKKLSASSFGIVPGLALRTTKDSLTLGSENTIGAPRSQLQCLCADNGNYRV
jgi:uncharacterized protein